MKIKDIKSIWQVPKYLPFIQPDLTEDLIKQAELKIGFKLPEKYLELLKFQNGGYIRFTLKDTIHRQIFGIGPNYPSIIDYEWLKDYEDLSFDTINLFPFDGDGHWNICLDYRKNKINPEITYVDLEEDFEKLIASNFDEYLNQLELETGNEYVIETNYTIESTIQKISEIAKIEFEEPDFWTQGYPIYRSNFHECWVWISPNNVKSSFIRENDPRY